MPHRFLQDPQWHKATTDINGNVTPIGDAHKIAFGDTTSAGYVTFYDALYIPETGKDKRPLWPDIITVHHKEYYGTTTQAPADWDSPTPIPFLTATGNYLVALEGPSAWIDSIFTILELALRDLGIGAKTSSGYGRMELLVSRSQEEQQRDEAALTAFRRRVETSVAGSIANLIPDWNRLPDSVKRAAADAMMARGKVLFRANASSKPWYQRLEVFLTEAA